MPAPYTAVRHTPASFSCLTPPSHCTILAAPLVKSR